MGSSEGFEPSSHVFAERVFSEESCTSTRPDASYTCCYQIYDIEGPSIEVVATYCKECTFYPDREDVCTEPKKEALEEPPTPPPSGPSVVPGEGSLSQDGGVLQQPPTSTSPQIGRIAPQIAPPTSADEGMEPPTIAGEEPLPCPEGLELDEESGLCVPIQPEAAEEPEQPEAQEEQQPFE
jgi:hypothetical protein